ncbi:MAG TPA: hypothetical protein VLV54_08410 [Thermoanaerobaculia bacterium]|nr:hypothetical protein [Thermoanaerobaculia bacterium]
MSGLLLPTWLLKGFRETLFGVFLAWLGTFTYDRLVRPLAASPVHVGKNQEERRSEVGSHLAPPVTPPSPAPPPPTATTPPVLVKETLPVGPITFTDGTQADVYGHQCHLPNGHTSNFRVVIFSAAYSWSYERDDQVQLNGQVLPAEEFVHLLESSRGLREILGKAHELIAVGTASCEGSEQSQEDDRARSRALALAAWMERARPWPDGVSRPVLSVHRLSLGQYRPDRTRGQACDPAHSGETVDQRKVILMAVVEREADADLQWCIEQSLRRDDQLESWLGHYHRFDLNATSAGDLQ